MKAAGHGSWVRVPQQKRLKPHSRFVGRFASNAWFNAAAEMWIGVSFSPRVLARRLDSDVIVFYGFTYVQDKDDPENNGSTIEPKIDRQAKAAATL